MKADIILITADQMRTDNMPAYEGLHFDTAGQIELGRRIAGTIK